jgi:hypothetical protein
MSKAPETVPVMHTNLIITFIVTMNISAFLDLSLSKVGLS